MKPDSIAFALAGMTLMGLPPSAGFLAKWQIIEAAPKILARP